MNTQEHLENCTSRRLGQRVRAFRERAGLSLVQCGELAKMAPNHLCNLENGKSNPTVNTLQRVANALGVSLAEIISTEKI